MSIYDIPVKTLLGKPFSFADLKGKYILLVNVASKCGYTPQYTPLQAIHGDKVFVVGFPCNQFGKQEPGTPEEITSFCSLNYNVTFPLLEKGDVNGPNTHPLFQYIKSQIPGDVKWNFEKVLISPEGKIMERFKSGITPQDIVSKL